MLLKFQLVQVNVLLNFNSLVFSIKASCWNFLWCYWSFKLLKFQVVEISISLVIQWQDLSPKIILAQTLYCRKFYRFGGTNVCLGCCRYFRHSVLTDF